MDIQQVKKEIGKRLRQAREERGYTQERIAELFGRTQVWYSAIERGRTLIGLEHLLKLPAILDKPITYFLPNSVVSEAEEKRLMLDPRFLEIARIWTELNEDRKKLLHELFVAMREKQQGGNNETATGPAPSTEGDTRT